jgi:hypothetical protein
VELREQEKQFVRVLSGVFAKEKDAVLSDLAAGGFRISSVDWGRMQEKVRIAAYWNLVELYDIGLQEDLQDTGYVPDQDGVAADREQYANRHAEELAMLLVGTSRRRLGLALDNWRKRIAGDVTIPGAENVPVSNEYMDGRDEEGVLRRILRDVRALVMREFNTYRAYLVAITESTRAIQAARQFVDRIVIGRNRLYSVGNENREQQYEVMWYTMEDERVCEVCGPLHETYRGKAWLSYPPLHPNCRCRTVRVRIDNG